MTPQRGEKRGIDKLAVKETPTKDVNRVQKSRPVRFGKAATPESKLRGTKTQTKPSPKVPKRGTQTSSNSTELQESSRPQKTAVAEKDLLALDSSDEDCFTKAGKKS